MALLGEVTLLAGLLSAASAADSMVLSDLAGTIAEAPGKHLIIGLLLAGFGVKAGLPLLHFWLPLAHPVAPTPASAVLSGAMIKAGLLGWLVTLPLGEIALPGWGALVIAAGATAALGGAVIGVCQKDPKVVLAYSSISQMGLMTIMVGVALSDNQKATVLVPAIALYALHHGLAKGSLFLSVGLSLPRQRVTRGFVWLLIALPGLSLAGLPLTSGAVSKLAMKSALSAEGVDSPLAPVLEPLMITIAAATMILVIRYLWTLQQQLAVGQLSLVRYSGWGIAAVASLVLFWWMPWRVSHLVVESVLLPEPGQMWTLMWPLFVAAMMALVARYSVVRWPALPPGDGVVIVEWVIKLTLARMAFGSHQSEKESAPGLEPHNDARLGRGFQAAERMFRGNGALLMVVVILALMFFAAG
jgi:formate hydrogenlyase subunit 3/multisubunit Na+/H+ antiporter MnhD subunit